MNLERVDAIVQYCLAVAGQFDQDERELGTIHLLKYVYLADMIYAKKYEGQTFTGVPWTFYHFGPWAAEAHERIRPAALAVGASERAYQWDDDEKDRYRWRLDDEERLHALERMLPTELTSPLSRLIRQFKSYTSDLLHYVYATPPVLRAAPGERLDFYPEQILAETTERQSVELSTAQIRKLKDLRKRFRERLAERQKERELAPPDPPPRYDDVFLKGVAWLNELDGKPVEPSQGELIFAEDIWKSRSRHDPELA